MNVVRKELRGYLRVWRGYGRVEVGMERVWRGLGESMGLVCILYGEGRG
jgi:hypothetical protein